MTKCKLCKENEALSYLEEFFRDTAVCKECIEGYKEFVRYADER